MALRCRVQVKTLSRYMASTGIVQDAISLQGPRQSFPGGLLMTIEIHLLFATEAVYPVLGVSNTGAKFCGNIRWLHRVLDSSFWKYKLDSQVRTFLP